MENTPLKHHYIPKFILKNFVNEDGQVFFYNNKSKFLEKRNIKSVFMNERMYEQDGIVEDDDFVIEKNLATFEGEIAQLINAKILNKSEIVLTRKELESLRIFLCLLSFRSDLRMKQYLSENFVGSTKSILDRFNTEEDYVTFWKKEINELALCRTANDVENCRIVDPIIKLDFSNLLKGCYMTVVDTRGQDLILSDVYPTLEVFPINATTNLHLHHLYPITPNRMLLLNMTVFRKELMGTSDPIIKPLIEISKIKGNMIEVPKNKYVCPGYHNDNDLYIYRVNKIYKDDVMYLNMLALNETRNGFIFNNKERIADSIKKYNRENREYNKNNFDNLEKIHFND